MDGDGGEARIPFMFVPAGSEPSPKWLADHSGWIKFPGTMKQLFGVGPSELDNPPASDSNQAYSYAAATDNEPSLAIERVSDVRPQQPNRTGPAPPLPDAKSGILATAQDHARAHNRQHARHKHQPAKPAHRTTPGPTQKKVESPVGVKPPTTPDETNANNRAAIITTEAGGEAAAEMIAVGWTVRHRMQRNGTTEVDQVWGRYVHRKPPTKDAIEIAKSILSGATPDPTGGATHIYTPDIMPKERGDTTHFDTKGGLEQTPGVVDEHGHAIRNCSAHRGS